MIDELLVQDGSSRKKSWLFDREVTTLKPVDCNQCCRSKKEKSAIKSQNSSAGISMAGCDVVSPL